MSPISKAWIYLTLSAAFNGLGISVMAQDCDVTITGPSIVENGDSQTYSASGGGGNYTWSISSGSSKASIDPDTGELTGNDVSDSKDDVTVHVDEADSGNTDDATVTIADIVDENETEKLWFFVKKRGFSATILEALGDARQRIFLDGPWAENTVAGC